LSRLKNTDDGIMDEIHFLRRKYNADMVTLLGNNISSNNVTGIAYVLNNDSYGGSPLNAFSVVKISEAAASYTLAHELAHNMGCGHHSDIDRNRLYSYSSGWRGVTGQGTKHTSIMAYETHGNYAVEPYVIYRHVPYFSSPNTIIEGAAIGNAGTMDNSKTLKQTKTLVSEYSNPDGELDWMDNFLKDIQISEGMLSPVFSPEIKQYSVSVDNSTTGININGIVNFWGASVTGNGYVSLQEGDNIITLAVENGWQNGAVRIYTVTVNRAPYNGGTTTNINENIDKQITVFPNPAIDDVIINNGKVKVGDRIEILDATGKLLLSSSLNAKYAINVSTLQKGIYIIKINDFKGKFVKK
jgi:hypothetical protein